jgi:hypothetical protein
MHACTPANFLDVLCLQADEFLVPESGSACHLCLICVRVCVTLRPRLLIYFFASRMALAHKAVRPAPSTSSPSLICYLCSTIDATVSITPAVSHKGTVFAVTMSTSSIMHINGLSQTKQVPTRLPSGGRPHASPLVSPAQATLVSASIDTCLRYSGSTSIFLSALRGPWEDGENLLA